MNERPFAPHYSWERAPQGFNVKSAYAATDVLYTITDADLNRVHPHLAVAVHIMYDKVPSFCGIFANKLARLLHGSLFVKASDGAEVFLENMRGINYSNKYVWFRADGMTVERVSHPEHPELLLPIPYGEADRVTRVPRAWLDAHFLGWKGRWDAVQALEVDFPACLDQVFTPAGTEQPGALPTAFQFD